ncbi:MAG: hypothetical protein ACE5JH_09175 [Acidobacteriota bacterium]
MRQRKPRQRAGPDDVAGRVIRRELERRLALLDAADESAFGRFTALDWMFCVVAFVILPLLLVWWAA